ncbi:MAG TPA: tetratricopeptide repeat protein [Polyangiaceae bacterium]
MNDPLPLIEEGVNPFETELLRAGRRDAIPSSSRQRILTGLGIGGGLLAATTIASGVKATSAKGLLSTLGLGATVGAVGAVAVWAGVTALTPDQLPAPASKISVSQPAAQAVAAPAPVPDPEPAAEPEAVVLEPKQSAKSVAPSRGTAASDSLALELTAIEEARRALRSGDYALALRLLDDYTRRFSKRHLDSEATVLRIETLAKKGDRAAAARLGKSFLAGHPNGPYARRVRSLVGEP